VSRSGNGSPGGGPSGGGNDGDCGPDTVRRLYARLLSLYPAAFRERYGADLLQVFDDRRREPRFQGVVGGIRLVLFVLRDFVTSMPMTHERTNEQTRWEGMVSDLLRDFRYAVRMLVKSPMFTIAAVITLALGIGLNAATFSAVRGLLLRPLDGVREPERLVQLYRKWPGMDYGSTSIPHYQDLRDRSGEVFSDVAAWNFIPMSLSADGRSERLMGMLVSANFFQTYGVRPALGRFFTPGVEDRDPGAHPVVVLGHGFWQSRFGSDPSLVGRTLVVNGQPFEVVGVAPADFKGWCCSSTAAGGSGVTSARSDRSRSGSWLKATWWWPPTTGFAPQSRCCLLYTSPSPRDRQKSRMPSSA